MIQIVLFILTILGALFYNTFAWGFVFLKLWNWFIVSQFNDLPNVTFKSMVGIVFIIGAIQSMNHLLIKDEFRKTDIEPQVALISPWVILLCGWVLKLFIF